MENEVLLTCEKICKDFGITKALKSVDFQVSRGVICGLIGENGSGKSTLSAIISGIYSATSGSMTYKGSPWKPRDVMESQNNGICIIVQEAGTIGRLTVAENIFLGQEERFRKGIFIDYKKMYAEAGKLLSDMGIDSIRPQMPIAALNLQQRKLVEIAKAYNYKPEILIVDETTNALSHKERQLLFNLIHRMAKENKAVIIISHDIEEVMEHCDKISILKDGELVNTVSKEEVTARKIKEMMVGRDVEDGFYRTDMDGYSDEVVLKADNITTLNEIMNLSLELHKGEILGIGGLSDCGMHTLGKALYGEEPVISGSVTVGSGKAPMDVKVVTMTSIGDSTKNSYETLDVTGNPSLNGSLLITKSRYTLPVVMAINAVNGDADAVMEDGQATDYHSPMWVCKDAEDYATIQDMDTTPETYVYTIDDLKQMIKYYNPDMCPDVLREWAANASRESVMERRGLS